MWLYVIVFLIIFMIGNWNKKKRLLISILLFLYGSLPVIIFGLIEIGMRAYKDWTIIIFVALALGVTFSLSGPITWWYLEKGIFIIQRFFRDLSLRKNKHK